MFRMLWQDEEGLTTVEYALLLTMVAFAAVVAWGALGGRVSGPPQTMARGLGHSPSSGGPGVSPF